MQNATVSGNPAPAAPHPYSPSVPISLYREITAELQATQAMLESFKAQNQHLVQQNQQLRQEIQTLVNAAVQFQQTVNSAQTSSQNGTPQTPPIELLNFSLESAPPTFPPVNNSTPEPTSVAHPVPLPFAFSSPEPPVPLLSEQLFTEEPEAPYQQRSESKTASEIGGLWLAVVMFLIVIAAFGAGYWIVRPLLMKR